MDRDRARRPGGRGGGRRRRDPVDHGFRGTARHHRGRGQGSDRPRAQDRRTHRPQDLPDPGDRCRGRALRQRRLGQPCRYDLDPPLRAGGGAVAAAFGRHPGQALGPDRAGHPARDRPGGPRQLGDDGRGRDRREGRRGGGRRCAPAVVRPGRHPRRHPDLQERQDRRGDTPSSGAPGGPRRERFVAPGSGARGRLQRRAVQGRGHTRLVRATVRRRPLPGQIERRGRRRHGHRRWPDRRAHDRPGPRSEDPGAWAKPGRPGCAGRRGATAARALRPERPGRARGDDLQADRADRQGRFE